MLKRHKRESYEEVLINLLEEYEEDTLNDEEIEDIKEALEEVKRGETISIEEVAKGFGIVLR